MKAFIDIDIGDAQRYATAIAAYQHASDWLAAVGPQVRHKCESHEQSNIK